MEIDVNRIKEATKIYGGTFYILDSEQFKENYKNLLGEFRKIYENSYIAYSYKTNYTPKLCYMVDKLGGFAEVVSDMEATIALKVGVAPNKIYFNGPYKNIKFVEQLLIDGGCVNIDSKEELNKILDIANRNIDKTLNVGIRMNFDIEDGVVSRFGFDINSEDFKYCIDSIRKTKNLHLKGLHSHFASRDIKFWPNRIKNICEIIDKYFPNDKFEYIDLGGGLFGNMKESLKKQFSSYIPNYKEYAESVAITFKQYFDKKDYKPMLFIEPGSALAGDCMKFVSEVFSIKNVRGKNIATLLGSIYNINPTLNKKNPPISIIANGNKQKEYTSLDFGGFTCIESDYLYRDFNGKLAVGDQVLFENVGSYSVVLKPPFILPNFPVLDLSNGIEEIKRQEVFEDLFKTYKFDFNGEF